MDESEMVFVPDELATKFNRSVAVHNDLVFTCWGTVGQLGILDDCAAHDKYLVSNKQMKMSVDINQALPLFLYYYLSQPAMVALVKGQAIGSSVPGFNLGQLKSVAVAIPDLGTQRAIIEVLCALDDKITANERVVEGADELSRVKWLEATVGAGLVRLSETANFVNGRAFTKGATGAGRVVVRIAELNSGIGSSTVYNDIEVSEEHLVRPGDLLFAWSGSLTVARWYRPEAIVNQHIFKVIPKAGYPMWLVNQAVRSKLSDYKAIASDKATTMGHIQRRHLDEEVRIPLPDAIKCLDAVMASLWSAALAAEIENLHLVRTRDSLLPMLMSGEVTVKTAEKIVGDVT